MNTRRPDTNFRPESAPEPARDVVTPIAAERSRAAGEGCRETKKDAEDYRRTGCQESLKSQADVVVGLPKVETFEASGRASREPAAKAA